MKKDIDMKIGQQRFMGFYIHRYKNHYDVGKNGSSCHTRIFRKDKNIEEIREEISEYIYEKDAQLREQEANNG